MSAQPVFSGPGHPLPSLTPDALRAAVAQLVPGRLAEFGEHLARAASQAQESGSLVPLRSFVDYWAIVVGIERDPERAARFHELEAVVDAGLDPEAAAAAVTEIGVIVDTVRAEARG